MSGLRSRNSCRYAFRDLGTLPLQSQYIYSLLMFVVNNMGLYHTTYAECWQCTVSFAWMFWMLNKYNTIQLHIHRLNTRHKLDLYRPQTNPTIYQRSPYYFGIKLFSHLPLNIKELARDTKQFSKALNAFLHSKFFYTLDEYFN
jgi:hypothetical protein